MAKLNIRNRNKDKFYKDRRPKPPNWEYRFEGAKINGKRTQISNAGYSTKKEAEIAGTKALAEYNNGGVHFTPSEISFSDYLDYWLENYSKSSCRYNTQNIHKRIIENHLKPSLGMYRLKSLTPAIIQEYVNKKFASGLKKNTLDGILSTLRASLKYAVVPAQMLQSSPAEYIIYPKLNFDRTASNRVIISSEDFEKMMQKFPKGNPFRYALLIGFYGGLRIGEVYALTWDDIDLNEGYISINKGIYKRYHTLQDKKSEEKSAWYFGDTKTYSSIRKIKIGKTLVSELKEYKKLQLENQLYYGEYYTDIFKKSETDEKGNTIFRLIEIEKTVPALLPAANMIMRKENGQYSSTDSFKYAARVIHYDLNIDFNFHSLRHTHATRLIENGISPKVVQARLGHERIETTLQTYVHNTEQMELEAVNSFEEIMSTRVI